MNNPQPKHHSDADGAPQIEETVHFLEDLDAEDDPYLKSVLEDARRDYNRSLKGSRDTNGNE